VLFDDGKYAAVDGEVKPGDQIIVEGQLRVDPSGAVNIVGPAGGSPTASDGAGVLHP